MIEHVARVAEAVPSWARTTAWLHDLLELTPISTLELRSRGVPAAECQALELPTRREQQPYAWARRYLLAHGAEPAGLVTARTG